ncbi:hypothetical protein WCLE_001860 [Wolbachia endosymbiont of Cimex lectularius]|nr:hypothetical protein WCLE_001860 [Wolbachia endosymbiont of Cimex lectularius]
MVYLHFTNILTFISNELSLLYANVKHTSVVCEGSVLNVVTDFA